MERSILSRDILSLDILVEDRIQLNTLSNFVDWFAPNRETKNKLKEIISIIGNELEEYRKLKGQNEWH